jgi:integrase
VEFLDLSWPQIDEAACHIRIKRAKQRGKKRGEVVEQTEITPQISELIARLRIVRARQKNLECLYVFPIRSGTSYTQAAFKAMWQKLMVDAINKKVIAHRFTFHDLRAYYVTQHKAERGALPDLHANPAMTARVYDRSKVVKRRGL